MNNLISMFCWFIVFVLIVSAIVLGVASYIIDYQYEKKIGSYFDNAIDMNTPDKMLQQVELGKQAMIDEGLTKEDYGVVFFKKPSNSMDFQFSHIDSIIERIKAVQDWKDKSYGNNTQSETMGDVYEQKMTNLRKFIAEDLNGLSIRSDWIAKDSWYIKNYILFYFSFEVSLVLLALIILFGLIGGATWVDY